jgi:hypothetical protein
MRFSICDHLSCQVLVGLRTAALRSIDADGLPVDRGLGQPDAPRDDRPEDPAGEVLPDLVGDLGGEPRPGVVHGEHHAEDIEPRVEHLAQEAQGAGQLPEPFERVVLALNRDEDGVGGREAVDSKQAQ